MPIVEHGFLFSSVLQKNPDLISQIVVPQLQLLGLANEPLTSPHLAKIEHLLLDPRQKSPVDVEQVFEPQMQLLAFTEDPSVDAQRTSWPH